MRPDPAILWVVVVALGHREGRVVDQRRVCPVCRLGHIWVLDIFVGSTIGELRSLCLEGHALCNAVVAV